jgi:dipeptidyl aminopeptidase/acylaminoacyl peptidase
VEYCHWSPTGRYILLGLAGFGADLAGIEGGGRPVGQPDELPAWMPEIETADAEHLWRSLWVLDTETGEQRRLTREGLNPWEANWCGDAQVVAVASESHSEGSWYMAKLYLLDVKSAQEEVIYRPTLSLAGARDQNTPPTQALEFHRALRENGVESALALYPNGVHGLMTFPENTDATTRTIGWFLKHLGSR